MTDKIHKKYEFDFLKA